MIYKQLATGLICICISIYTPVKAQIQRKKINTIIECGINISNSSEDTAPLKKECPILPRIGIIIDYPFSKCVGVESGLLYSQKGLKSKGKKDPVQATVKLDQQVLEIPILITYQIGFSNSKFKVGSGIGGYFSYGIGGKSKAKGIAFGQKINKELNTFNTILKKQDFGLNCKMSLGYEQYTMNVGYEFGLNNIGKSNMVGKNLDYKNRVVSVTFGYKLRI